MNRLLWVIVGLAGVCLVCLVPALAMGAASGEAVRAALADDTKAGSEQRVTAVCVGLNLGSCQTTQSSTTTAARSESSNRQAFAPWEVPLLMAIAVALPFCAALLLFRERER